MNVISCLIDLTETGKTAATYSTWLANHYGATLNLIYFTDKLKDENALRKKVLDHSGVAATSIEHSCTLITGKYQDVVPQAVRDNNADILVVGSHGTDSFAEYWTAKNVVDLIQLISIPTLVVNENTKNVTPEIKTILFPMAPHDIFDIQIEEASKWASRNNAQIEIFCLVGEDGKIPADIARNIDDSETYFKKEQIKHTKTIKETKVYSIGYAKDILKYAAENDFDLITVMSLNSEENMYFGDVEKTNLLKNDLGIPVLCSNR